MSSSGGAGSIYGTIGMTGQMAANDFNPWQSIGSPVNLPGYDWWNNASKANTSYGSYADPGNYSMKNDWSIWEQGKDRTAYSGQEATYNKLSDGDYNVLQQSLQKPGEIAAGNAYATSSKNTNNQMNGRGLYGSSMASNQANQGANKTYQDTLATNAANAATSRYGLQQKDQQFDWTSKYQNWKARLDENTDLSKMNLQENYYKNQFNQNRDQMQLNQNMDYNNYNYKKAALQNSYTDAAANYGLKANTYNNELLKAPYDDAWKRTQWDASERQSVYDNYKDYWSGVNPTSEENTQNQTASLASSRSSSGDTDWGSIAGGAGSLAGTLGSAAIKAGGWAGLLSAS